MVRYFSRTRSDGSPSEANAKRYVNRQPVPDGAAYCHATAEGLMRDDALLVLATDPTANLDEWSVAEIEVDAASIVIPDPDEVLTGVFAIPLAEIRRTPLVDFVERYASEGTPQEQDAATALQIFMDVSRSP